MSCDAAFFGSLPVQVHPVSVRALEAADADTQHRMRRRDADPVRDEVAPAARRAVQPARRVVLERAPDLRLRDRDPREHGERERDRDERAPAPRDERRADHDDEQRREARLRERDQQAEPRSRRAPRRRRSDQRSERAEHEQHERRRHRDARGTARRPTGSQKTELTRKNGAYAFELITFGFWKMSRVSYW